METHSGHEIYNSETVQFCVSVAMLFLNILRLSLSFHQLEGDLESRKLFSHAFIILCDYKIFYRLFVHVKAKIAVSEAYLLTVAFPTKIL